MTTVGGSSETLDLRTWLQLPTTNNNTDNNDPSLLQAVLDPHSYVLDYWEQETRPDGRLLGQVRTTHVQTDLLTKTTAASALVRQGNTKVLATIAFQVGQVAPEFPNHGDVQVTVRNTTTTTSRSNNQSKEDALQSRLQRRLDDVLPPHLGLIPGKVALRAMVTLLVLEEDGTVGDAALLACMVAWRQAKLPTVGEDYCLGEDGHQLWLAPNDENEEQSEKETAAPPPKPSYQISLTMGVIASMSTDDSDDIRLLVDPSELEESHVGGLLTMVVTINTKERNNVSETNHALQMEYSGNLALRVQDMALAAKLAQGRAQEVSSFLV